MKKNEAIFLWNKIPLKYNQTVKTEDLTRMKSKIQVVKIQSVDSSGHIPG